MASGKYYQDPTDALQCVDTGTTINFSFLIK